MCVPIALEPRAHAPLGPTLQFTWTARLVFYSSEYHSKPPQTHVWRATRPRHTRAPMGAIFSSILTKWLQLLNRLQFVLLTCAVMYRVYLDQFVFTLGPSA